MTRIYEIYSNGIQRKESIKKVLTIMLYLLFLLYGLLVYKDYGISMDEKIQRHHGLVNLKYVFEFFGITDKMPGYLNGISDSLQDYVGKYYGVGIKIPLILVEYINNFEMSKQQIYHMNHLYTFLLYFLASIFIFKIAGKIGLGYWYKMFSAILFMVCPRILADSFYNIKDSAFLSLFVVMLYFGLAVIWEFNFRNGMGLAVSAAFCINTRIIAGLPLVVLCIVFIFQSKEMWLRNLGRVLGVGCISCMIYFMITPASWSNFFGYVYHAVFTFSNYGHLGTVGLGNVLYDNDNLPWYYTILCIVMTMPNLYIVLSVAGFGIKIKQSMNRKCITSNKENLLIFTLLLQFLIIVSYDAVMQPVKYTLWRHFYFLFVYIVIFASIGVKYIGQRFRQYRCVIIAAIGISMVWTVGWNIKNHPYEFLYFNPLYVTNKEELTERDYWHVSGQGLLKTINDDKDIDLYNYDTNPLYVLHTMFFGEDGWENYHESREEYGGEYFVRFWNEQKNSILYHEINNVTVSGRKASALMKRIHYDDCILKYLLHSDGTITENNNKTEIKWKCTDHKGEKYLTADIPDEYCVYQLDFFLSKAKKVSNIKAFVSSDGKQWNQYENKTHVYTGNTMFSVISESRMPRYLLIKYNTTENVDCSIRVYGEQLSDVSYVSGKYNQDDLKYLIDGNLDTRWSSNEPQQEGMYVEFGLKKEKMVKGIKISSGDSYSDYSRKLTIQYQTVSGSFQCIPYTAEEEDQYVFDEPVRCSVIRLVNMDDQEVCWWSIHEVEFEFESNYFWTYRDSRDLVVRMSSSEHLEDIWNILDNDSASRWSSGMSQSRDMYIEMELKPGSPIIGFHLDNGGFIFESARGIRISGSQNGKDWEDIPYSYGAASDYVFDQLCDYPYYRIDQTGKDDSYQWSIAELGILRAE